MLAAAEGSYGARPSNPRLVRKLLRKLAGPMTFLVGTIYGVLIVWGHLFPYSVLVALRAPAAPSAIKQERLDQVRSEISKTIQVQDAQSAAAIRSNMIRIIWHGEGIPDMAPSNIERGYGSTIYAFSSAARVDRITVSMDHGLESIIYHIHPRRPNGQIVLYHFGHEDGSGHVPVIERLVSEGFSVVVFSMPLLGENPQPLSRVRGLGTIRAIDHNSLAYFEPRQGSPLRYFLDPVVAILNYLEPMQYQSTAMMGLSGGGWTTTLMAALDERIQKSFPVAGTMPLALRNAAGGDYEQDTTELYKHVGYQDMYVLAVTNGRTQVQILNQYDTCCFPGVALSAYDSAVTSAAERVGGRFTGLVDHSHRGHSVSEWAVEAVIAQLRRAAS